MRRTCFEELFLLVTALAMAGAAADEEMGSPLRVAQCRARCIVRFSKGRQDDKSPTCLQGPDCYMCWENCQLLQSNFAVWGAICDEKGICFPGCKEACQFHSEAESQRVPVIQTRGEDVVESGGGVASWPRPRGPGGPYVYVVMRRGPGAPWRQITQTERHSARVPDGGTLRVLAVSQRGLVTIYSPASGLARARQVAASLGQPGLIPGLRPTGPPAKRINTEIQPSTPFSLPQDEKESGHRWALREDSLIHQKVVVIAEISWEGPVTPRPVYFVTWEVDGGGLKGNLFTDSTSVTLSLWPNTVYHIQVELVGSGEGGAEKSEVLVVDTSRAVGVEMAERPVRVPAPRRGPPPELALGLAAVLALLAVLLVLALAARRRPSLPARKLLDDPPNIARVFPPMVSVVAEGQETSPHRTPRTLHV